jgi:hypothetical protein
MCTPSSTEPLCERALESLAAGGVREQPIEPHAQLAG